MRVLYKTIAQQFGIEWKGRRYDRADPLAADLPNQAINHAATAIEAAATVAVTGVGALPQLGFIHEDASIAFVLDIADLYRGDVTLPVRGRRLRRIQRPQVSRPNCGGVLAGPPGDAGRGSFSRVSSLSREIDFPGASSPGEAFS